MIRSSLVPVDRHIATTDWRDGHLGNSVNRKLGLAASLTLAGSTALFAVAMGIDQTPLSHAASMVLSWSFVLVVAGLATEAGPERRAAAYAAIAFSILYAAFASAVYFAQLTTVRLGTASPDILQALSFSSLGSLLFNFDLLCYAFMAASTFFIGLSMVPRDKLDLILKILLLIHGIFAPVCVLLPVLDVFGSMDIDEGNNIGTTVLFVWCLYFLPVGVLSVRHFQLARGVP